jgi:CheY-like chemotaxis protein
MVGKTENSDVRVLVVEDDKAACDILAQRFTDEGFTVATAANGQEALGEFDKESPNVILLDLYMPVMDGQAFLRELRKHPNGGKIPVIILSNWIRHDTVINAFDNNVVDYLLKTNVSLDSVVEKIIKASNTVKNV